MGMPPTECCLRSPGATNPEWVPSGELEVLPGDERALDPVQQNGAGETDHGDDHEADVHLLHLEDLPTGPDQVAQAALGADELGRDDHEQGNTHAKLYARHYQRQRARKRDVGEHHQPTGMEVLADVEVDPVNVAHTRDGVDQNEIDNGSGDDRVLALLTDTK